MSKNEMYKFIRELRLEHCFNNKEIYNNKFDKYLEVKNAYRI